MSPYCVLPYFVLQSMPCCEMHEQNLFAARTGADDQCMFSFSARREPFGRDNTLLWRPLFTIVPVHSPCFFENYQYRGGC